MIKFDLLVLGDTGWGDELLISCIMTILVSISAMGLGIFITKNLIENMGGNIKFYNSKDDNANVEIVFDNSILNI